MYDLTYQHKDILGLDIGTNSVKFAQLKKSNKLTKLVGYGNFKIPENIIIEGVIAEPEKLAENLKAILTAPPWGKITAKRVIASLPESRLFSRVLEVPVSSPKDIAEAVAYEVEQSIPIPATDLYIDWQTIEEKDDKTIIFLSAAPKAIVDSYIQLFNSLSMEPIALEISMAAIARSMISNKELSEPVIILDIGGQTTNLGIFDSNLRVTESHPVGGETIKETIISEMSVDAKEATKLLHEGLLGKSKAKDIIETNAKTIGAEIKKMVDYYSEKDQNKKINKVLLCGGLGYLPGLAEYIKTETGLDSRVGNPWVNISIYPLKPVPKEEASGYAAAIGLCLRGFSDD